jgi:hypothetical protein
MHVSSRPQAAAIHHLEGFGGPADRSRGAPSAPSRPTVLRNERRAARRYASVMMLTAKAVINAKIGRRR